MSPTPSVAISGLTCSLEMSAPLTTPTSAETASTAADGRQHHLGAALHDE